MRRAPLASVCVARNNVNKSRFRDAERRRSDVPSESAEHAALVHLYNIALAEPPCKHRRILLYCSVTLRMRDDRNKSYRAYLVKHIIHIFGRSVEKELRQDVIRSRNGRNQPL